MEIDTDYEQYMNLLNQPWFNNNEIPESVFPKNILKFINSVLNK